MKWIWAIFACLYACSDSGDGGGGFDRNMRPVGAAGVGAGSGGTGIGLGTGGFGDGPVGTGAGGSAQPPLFDPTMCTNVTLNATRVTPTVMLVVDGSQSMVTNMYGAGTRWDAIRTALIDPTMGVVPALQDLVKFGLAVYGTMPSCPLPLNVVMPALANAPAVTSGMPAQPPGMFTPTGLALSQVVDMLPNPVSPDPDVQIEPQIIVLATDGDPNDCNLDPFAGGGMANYQPSIDAAMKLQAKNQKMYVISVGMDAAVTHLQEMANIGAGMPREMTPGATVFYPEDPASLAATLQQLVGDEISCVVTLEGQGVIVGKECMGTVTLNGTPLECNGENGWRLNDALHIELLGAPCEEFKMSASARLVANFPCDAVE
jgi:von Willebrand factor type A domain